MRILTGSIKSSVTAKQLPDIRYEVLNLMPGISNTGVMYVGNSANVTVPSGAADNTTDGFEVYEYTGVQLSNPGNMNELWVIGTDADDWFTYLVQA